LQELHQYLPAILKTVLEVKGKSILIQYTNETIYRLSSEYLAAFVALSASYHAALAKINSGVTDPAQIFAQGHEQVVDSWKAFEAKRKTMTYLPYKY
jgi:hypothetical protein